MPGSKHSSDRFDGVAKRADALLEMIDKSLSLGAGMPTFAEVRDCFPGETEASCWSYLMALASRGVIDVELSCRPPVILRRVMA